MNEQHPVETSADTPVETPPAPAAGTPSVGRQPDVVMPEVADADALHASLDEIRRTLDGVESGLAGIRAGSRSRRRSPARPSPAPLSPGALSPGPLSPGPPAGAPGPAPSSADPDVDLFTPAAERAKASAARPVEPSGTLLTEEDPEFDTVGRHRQGRDRRVVAALAGLLAVAAVALVVAAVSLWEGRQPAPAELPTPGLGVAVTPPAASGALDATASPVRASTALDGLPLLWPGSTTEAPAQLPTRGPGVDAPGTDVVVAPGSNGVVDVYERVQVRAPDPAGLRLTLADLARVATLTIGTTVAVTDLRVTVDGAPAQVTSVPGADDPATANWLVRTGDGGPVRRAVLRYRLSGALIQRQQSVAGRALILVVPLSAGVSLPARDPVLVHPDGVKVREMTCPLAPVTEALCGSAGRPAWVARVPASSPVPLVMLQVDLPS